MVSSDSRETLPGGLFVAIRGFLVDGHNFVADALRRGAGAVICEDFPKGEVPSGVCFIRVLDARRALAEAAFAFYGGAPEQLAVIGVTGTNGKTTTAMLIAAMLNRNGIRCGYIGTGRAVIGDEEIPLERTTPEAHGLHRLLRRMVDAGCRAVSMEVSSHALMLQRVHSVRFRVAVFTNLTAEHLDFHGSMEEYAEAKRRLFRQLLPGGRAVFNMDRPPSPPLWLKESRRSRAAGALFPVRRTGRMRRMGSSAGIGSGRRCSARMLSPRACGFHSLMESLRGGFGFREDLM